MSVRILAYKCAQSNRCPSVNALKQNGYVDPHVDEIRGKDPQYLHRLLPLRRYSIRKINYG